MAPTRPERSPTCAAVADECREARYVGDQAVAADGDSLHPLERVERLLESPSAYVGGYNITWSM